MSGNSVEGFHRYPIDAADGCAIRLSSIEGTGVPPSIPGVASGSIDGWTEFAETLTTEGEAVFPEASPGFERGSSRPRVPAPCWVIDQWPYLLVASLSGHRDR